MKGQDILFSHKSDDYITPDWLIEQLKKGYNIQLDACTTEDNPLNIKKFYTKQDDGLSQEWVTWTYCNTPYSQITSWVSKADIEANKENFSLMLLPARTDTKWFHEYIYNIYKISFLQGRLRFEGTKNSAPFPSMLVIFR